MTPRRLLGTLAVCVVLVFAFPHTGFAQACSACGPGPHWIDGCAAGPDTMPTSALMGIDTNLDCFPDTNVILSGPITVVRTAPADDSANFPGTRPVDGHTDVIDTEIVSMNLTNGTVTLKAGTDAAMDPGTATCSTPGAGAVPKSCGTIAEQPLNDAVGDSFFDVWFEVEYAPNMYAWNHTALRVSTAITCVPPATDYMKVVGCLPLYDSPVGGTLVAYLTTAIHNTIVEAHVAPVEYSNLVDEQAVLGGGAHNGADPEQVLYTVPIDPVGPPFPADTQDFSSNGEVDALANRHDAFFFSLWYGWADLLISIAGDPLMPPGIAVYVETATGAKGIKWAQMHLNNPNLAPAELDDLDGLELWGPFHDGVSPLSGWDANMYSLTTEPGGTSVYYYPAPAGPRVPYVSQATIFAAVSSLGFSGTVGQIELDALMVCDHGTVGVWDTGDRIMFSIQAAANWDGGEIVRLPFGGAASFLPHGGHLWDTAFPVGPSFGVASEEVDAMEATPPKGDQWGCCLVGECEMLEMGSGCADAGGSYAGDGTVCSGDQGGACAVAPIPAVSTWGLIIMTVLLLAAGTLIWRRRQAATA